ncbi:MAG: hypothetical protein JW850_21500 [Thermoflexales bacterium]|nr:hypothetical protein [Thermoflexales bacterium]
MELCSIFQDLSFSVQIAAHDAGLEHYAPHMYFDTVAAVQVYQECFAPEDWIPPFTSYAEIKFEISPLDIARSQIHDRDIVKTLGAVPKDKDSGEHLPIVAHLGVQFILEVSKLGQLSSENRDDYRHHLADRDQLQVRLENLRHSLQRVIKEDAIHIEASVTIAESGQLVLSKITAHWPVTIEVDIEDAVRQTRLEDMMNRIHAGLDTLETFGQNFAKDAEYPK